MATTAEPPAAVGTDRAQDLMRLGWAVAELRGRVGFGSRDPGRLMEAAPVRVDDALPLDEERTPEEQLHEVEQVLLALADRTGLAMDAGGQPPGPGATPPPAAPLSTARRIVELANEVPTDLADPERAPRWRAFAQALYDWDSSIQDALAPRSFGESSAYQLGRSLAESSWMLDPGTDPRSVSGWDYLLGESRCLAMTRLIDRVAPALPALGVLATKGSLAAWQRVAADERWRSVKGAPILLREQVANWRNLLVVGTSPGGLAKPSLLDRVSSTLSIVRKLAGHLVVGALFAALLGLGAWLLTRYGRAGPGGAIATTLGALGLTATGLSARAKTSANDLVARVRAAVEADLVVLAATIVPRKPRFTRGGPGALSVPGSISEPVSGSDVRSAGRPPEPAGGST